jgi:glucose/arabinose dehydrogenase
MRPDGSGYERFARGVQNSVGFDWRPDTKEPSLTDDGRDMLGDNLPSDERNRAVTAGEHPDPPRAARRNHAPEPQPSTSGNS